MSDAEQTILVLHWGRNGGGPRFAKRMSAGFASIAGLRVLNSFSVDAADPPGYAAPNDFPVRTYSRAIGVIVGLPRLVIIALSLRRYIRKERVNIVYSAMSSIWQSIAIRLILPSRTTFVASVHDAENHPGENYRISELCRRMEIARSNIIVTYSESVKTAVERRFGNRVPVLYVPHGADAAIATPREAPRGEFVVGFFGRVLQYKGVDLFVDAVIAAQQKSPRIRGAIFGDGEIDAQLVERSAGLIDWNIGWIAESEIEAILDGFDVLALPYREASQSGVLPLALARGLPSVATPVGGLAEQVRESEAGVLARAISAASFAASLLELEGDEEVYRLLSLNAVRRASELSWPTVASTLWAAIERCVST